MSFKHSKLAFSVSDELEFHIKAFLTKKGMDDQQAEEISKSTKSIRDALKQAGLSKIIDSNEIKANPRFDDIKKQFPKPKLLKKNFMPKSKTLSLAEVFHKCFNPITTTEEKDAKTEETKDLKFDENSNEFKIIDYALKKNIPREQAEALAESGLTFNEAIKIIEDIEFSRSKPKTLRSLGEKFIYLEGLDLTCKNCVICAEDFVMGENVLTLFCFHTYHSVCIEKWFRQSKNTKCPTCGQTNDDLLKLIN